ncbi:M20/M25/M40 family metallo-hydrolase [Paenarthrobacter sp. AB444]|uniref:M20/M25/M40 family metallo-hydrolase n=1 Tax=Paenarthrobacter sp. AB444 TaxID=3025681 RepID=UPI003FD23C42
MSCLGIVDLKTGLIQGISALKILREAGLRRPTVIFVFNSDEEIGSWAFRRHGSRSGPGLCNAGARVQPRRGV